MNDRMKYMDENIERVRRRKTIFYANVGQQFRKMYIRIMFPQNYIFCDNRMESHTDMHVSQSCNN
jgi:hypothetical protein